MREAIAAGLEIAATGEPPAGWDELLAAAPGADFFHGRLWSEAVCRHLPQYEPVWLAARRDGVLLGGLPALRRRRGPLATLLSHHDGTAAGPLVAAALPAAERRAVLLALLAAYDRLGRRGGLGASFVLHPELEGEFGPAARAAGWSATPVPTAVMPLAGGLAHVESHVLRKNRRNERNRSLREGCRLEVSRDPEVGRRYYPIYLAATRLWGVRPMPLALLQDLLRRAEGTAFLTVARWRDEIIGGHLCLAGPRRVTAWTGATRPEHADKHPATLLIWGDLVQACLRGADALDLGASGGLSGVEQFKRLLGTEEQPRFLYARRTAAGRLLDGLRARLRSAAPPARGKA